MSDAAVIACRSGAPGISADAGELGQARHVVVSRRRRHVVRLLDRGLRHPASREHKTGRCLKTCSASI